MALSSREAVIRGLREDYMNRRGAAYEECERKKLALYSEIPGLREIDATLALTATKVMEASVAGGDIKAKIEELKRENYEIRARRRALLEAHGYPGDYTDLKYCCDKCADTGFVGIDMCSCFKRELSLAMLESSGIGRLAETQSFENFSFDYYDGAARAAVEQNYARLKDFAETFSSASEENWLLFGDTGLGKTHLSTSVAVKVIERGYDVVYVTMQTMVDDFADLQFRGAERGGVSKYYDCDLLIVDDLGVELVNNFTVSCLYNIINTRVNSRRPIIFSTNLTGEELREKYQDRITSRMLGMFNILMFKGTDIRRQKLTKK